MTNTYFVFVVLTLHLCLVDSLLLDNINNQQKTTPSSSSHQDALIFLMQEVIQIKNILQEKTKELDKLRSTVTNQSSMFFNLTKELELLMNGRNTSDEIRKLSNEVAVLKFTVDNELANYFQTLTSTNLTEVLSKLHNLENSVRLVTIAMNQKVSTSEMTALEQRLSASSVTYITNHETTLQSFMKNITERVTALEQDKILPGKKTIYEFMYMYLLFPCNDDKISPKFSPQLIRMQTWIIGTKCELKIYLIFKYVEK